MQLIISGEVHDPNGGEGKCYVQVTQFEDDESISAFCVLNPSQRESCSKSAAGVGVQMDMIYAAYAPFVGACMARACALIVNCHLNPALERTFTELAYEGMRYQAGEFFWRVDRGDLKNFLSLVRQTAAEGAPA